MSFTHNPKCTSTVIYDLNGDIVVRKNNQDEKNYMRRVNDALTVSAALAQASSAQGPSNVSLEAFEAKQQYEEDQADIAITESIATDVKLFDSQPSKPKSYKEVLALLGTKITPVPKLHSDSKSNAITATEDENLLIMPAEIRGITLGYAINDIVSATDAYPYNPKSNNKFPFFSQTDLPVTAFLTHVVRGEMQEAKDMLEKNPSLVLYKGQVIDYSGRTIEGTAYQIALGADDVDTGKDAKGNDKNDGMAEMIRSYFLRACHSEKAANEERIKQFKEQFPEKEFPEYYEMDEKRREEIIKRKNANDPDIKALEAIVNAIVIADDKEIKCIPKGTKDVLGNDEYNLEVTGESAKALQAFRNYLKPQGIIKKGKHFNVQLLVKAFEKYGEQLDAVDAVHSNAPKFLLSWCQIIGYIERYLPANYAQAFCQGIITVAFFQSLWIAQLGGESLKRSLKLADGTSFFPTDLASCSGPGFDHAFGSTDAPQNCGSSTDLNYASFGLRELILAKQQSLQLHNNPMLNAEKNVCDKVAARHINNL